MVACEPPERDPHIGDTVQVKVLDIDRDRQRISLGLKQTQEDPWQRVVDTYNVGDELEGTVTKVVAFGAFVEIMEGVEGLVHISELAQQHVENPREIVQPGDEVKVKILEIESERRRLSLSIKRVEGQILPRRSAAEAGDLENVPELGLSEDVFAAQVDADGEEIVPAEVATEPEGETAAEPEAETAVAEPEAETAAEPEAETAAEPEAETAAEPEAETAAEPEAEVAVAEPEAETAEEPEAETAAEPEAAAEEPEPAAEADPEPEADETEKPD